MFRVCRKLNRECKAIPEFPIGGAGGVGLRAWFLELVGGVAV